jgi:DNA-binding Lrp family transcriptional regulator
LEIYSIMHKDIDDMILAMLEGDAKLTTGAIAKRTGIPTTTIHNRIKRMEKDGIIKGYTAVVDHARLGKGIHALIFINVEHKTDQETLAKRLLAIDQVENARIITGGFDMQIEIRAASIDELNRLITKTLHKVPGIEKTQTMIVLNEMN